MIVKRDITRDDDSQQENHQNVKGATNQSEDGGYMAVYHDIEEITYGPLCGLPAIARVLLCIRHKLLRDGLGQKAIGHSFVMEKTGLTKAQVINSAKKLERQGVIIIKADCEEISYGRIRYFENKYELNPVVFGEEYNWYKNNPTVRVYSRTGEAGSYSRKGVAPHVKPSPDPGIKSDTRVVSDQIPGKALKLVKLLPKSPPNNPSINNPLRKNLSISKEMREFLDQKSRATKGRWERVVDRVLTDHPKDEALLWLAIQTVHTTGKDLQGLPIKYSILGLFEKCDWVYLRAALSVRIEAHKADEEKKRKREENEKLLIEARRISNEGALSGIPTLARELEPEKDADTARQEISKIIQIIRGNTA